MINLLMRVLVAFNMSLGFSAFISKYAFEVGTTSYLIASIGMGLALTASFYKMLHNIFAVKLVVVEKETYAKMMEEEMRKAKEKVDDES